MSGWPTVALRDVARVVSGATPKTGSPELWDGGIPWATPKDLSGIGTVEIASTPRTISEAGLRSCSASLLPPDSVLLSSRAPIGHVAINSVPMATNQGFKSLVPDHDRLLPRYLYWWLRCHRDQIEALGNGATFKEISKKTTDAIEIPLPPIEEQRRIAAVLEAADELRAKRRRSLAELDTLARAIFIDMFGDPNNNAFTPRTPLGRVAEIVTGNTPSRADADNFGGHIEWIKSDNITKSGVVERATESLSEAGRRKGREAPVGSTLIVCIAGSPQSIGRVGLLDRPVAFNQQINAVVPNEDLLPEFLFHQLRTGQELVQRASTNSMKGMVSKSALAKVELLLPSMNSQQEFARSVSALKPLNVATCLSSTSLDALFASMQQSAFRGEL